MDSSDVVEKEVAMTVWRSGRFTGQCRQASCDHDGWQRRPVGDDIDRRHDGLKVSDGRYT
jgi:hypothetical protein